MHAVHKRNIGNSFPTPCWSTAVGCRYVSMSEMSEKTESGSWFELYTAYIIQKRNIYDKEISIKTTSHVYMLIYTLSAVTPDFKPVWHNRQHAVVCPKLKKFNRVYKCDYICNNYHNFNIYESFEIYWLMGVIRSGNSHLHWAEQCTNSVYMCPPYGYMWTLRDWGFTDTRPLTMWY